MSPATSRWPGPALWAGALLGLVVLMVWARTFRAELLIPLALLMAVVVVAWRAGAAANLPRQARRALLAGLALAGLAGVLAAVAQWRFERVEYRWEQLAAARDVQVARSLTERIEDLRARGEEAARLAAGQVADFAVMDLFGALDEVRERTDVSAIAVFNDVGDLIAWSGDHRGRLPETVRSGATRLHFEERPLFSYLYFVRPVPGRPEHVASAVLLETGLTDDAGSGFRTVLEAGTRARISFHAGHGAPADPRMWSLVADGDTIAFVRLAPVTQAEYRAAIEQFPARGVVLLTLLAYALLAFAWNLAHAPRRRAAFGPLLALVPLLAVAPLGRALALEGIFSPEMFVLPVRGDLTLTLGRLVALLIPLAALIAAMRRRALPGRILWLAVLAGMLIVALAYTAGLRLLLTGATSTLLESGAALWLGLELTAVLVLATLTALLMPRAEAAAAEPLSRPVLRLLTVTGVVLAGALGWLLAAGTDVDLPVSTRLAAFWMIPFALVAVGAAYHQGRGGAVRRWLLAGWLAATAVLPQLWGAQVQARLADAERDLATLGSQPDPFLNYLLEDFGRAALLRDAAGEDGVQLLYRTWVVSGLAREPYQAQLALWDSASIPAVQLGSLSEPLTRAERALLLELVDEARIEGVPAVSGVSGQPHMNRVLTVPLPDTRVITVVVPPRRTLSGVTGISLFLGNPVPAATRLNLVPAQEPESDVHAMAWERNPEGWRSRKIVQYPEGKYHAHLLVPVPPLGVWLARAALIIAFDLLVLLVLWAGGVIARGASPLPRGATTAWLGSFRARITLALFGFFLLPTAGFGYVAYRALAQEVERATASVAARAARQAVFEFDAAGGDLRELASHAGADVLRYHYGELLDVSSPEALDLGVYGAWMPPATYRLLRSGEEAAATDVQPFGEQRFVVAYHALLPVGTLAVPMTLVSADTAVRQRQLSHLVLFAVLIGALLSLALSVAVGRALAGPIGQLRRAAAAVGAGRLRVRLPEGEAGEFGQLFASFNHMVRRLRRARVRELRSARVLAWGEMARQVAHEIKNPLTPIKLSVQHLRRAHRDRHPEFGTVLESSVQEILGEIDRLSEIARAFSRYGAPPEAAGPLEAVDIAAVVREALTLYRTSDEPIEYHAVIDPGVPFVEARTGELKEVLLNLLENARAALDGSGRIVVRALAHGEEVDLEVEDDGSGIPRELHDRVFEPHFSTRSSGSGLGLAIVRRLVESWGGSVSVASAPAAGTTVRVRLRPAPRAGGALSESGS